MSELGPDYLVSLRESLSTFCAELGSFVKDQGGLPLPISQAASEQSAFTRPESLVTAFTIASQLIESGCEHVMAFVKTITEPIEPIACWTCVRSMLESCALASWLLDPDIDARTRVSRVFALRYEGLEQQLKFGRVVGRNDTELRNLEKHIDDVEQDAIRLGYSRVMSSKNKRLGIGQQMPGATEVIKMMLDEEARYRLLSAVAHGHTWAITSLVFKPKTSQSGVSSIAGVPVTGFEKTAYIQGIGYLGMGAAKALARPIWYQCRYSGWNEARFLSLLEYTFDKLRATPSARFWRV